MSQKIAIIGASGAIGNALVNYYAMQSEQNEILAFTRSVTTYGHNNVQNQLIDFDSEENLTDCAKYKTWDIVIIAVGILTDTFINKPEKSFKHLAADKLAYVYKINTIYPALVSKAFLPHLNKNKRSILAILSARVGSISDNQSGGWHAYRASKAALNMLVKNFAIEMQWRNKDVIIIGLHPGTVDSQLSKPFQNNLPKGQLFSPDQSAQYLANVIDKASIEQSGCCIAWDNKNIDA